MMAIWLPSSTRTAGGTAGMGEKWSVILWRWPCVTCCGFGGRAGCLARTFGCAFACGRENYGSTQAPLIMFLGVESTPLLRMLHVPGVRVCIYIYTLLLLAGRLTFLGIHR